MEGADIEKLVKQLAAGFEALQDEYQKLFGQHQIIQRKLVTAREQYNEIAKLYGTAQTATPPLSLSSCPIPSREECPVPTSVLDILSRSKDSESQEVAGKVRDAIAASRDLRQCLPDRVKVWSGLSADKQEGSSCMMPSISESPLEQDFTVEGKPSRLGCPFSSMANKRLSSHAASVLSRYNQSGSGGAHGSVGAASTPLSTSSRINGRESLSRRQSRKSSFVDPIKAEICGLSDHVSPAEAVDDVTEKKLGAATAKAEDAAEVGVCPIRFLDQHSPEEVATYFEKHKHELPRSHEVCVMRYQSNEEQIRELDAKYGNLVSMIQGLGQKHKDMLPADPDEVADDGSLSGAKIRKWANSVSAQAPEAGAEDEHEEREPHFERPVRDIRVGESPSRPWGIPVPAKYLEEAASETSSKPVQFAGPASSDVPPAAVKEVEQEAPRPVGKCPFGHGTGAAPPAGHPKRVTVDPVRPPESIKAEASPVAESPEAEQLHTTPTGVNQKNSAPPRMVFTGPVFIGYSPEDAAKILSGFRTNV